MSLDQDLLEIEPILRDTEGTFQFTHTSFQEILTAKQFADEINSGALSVRDAYVNYWSYEEDAELWGLPKDRVWRALLPAWKNVLLHLAPMLNTDKVQELVDAITKNYYEYENHFKPKEVLDYYNHLYNDLVCAANLIGVSKRTEKIETRQILQTFIKYARKDNQFFDNFAKIGGDEVANILIQCLYESEFGKEEVALALAQIGTEEAISSLVKYIIRNPRGLNNIYESLSHVWNEKTINTFVKYLEDDTNPDRYCMISLLEHIRNEKVVDALIKYMQNEMSPMRDYAISALGDSGDERAVDPLIEYMRNKNNPFRYYAALSLGGFKVKKVVDSLIDYLEDVSNPKRHCAAVALGEIGDEAAVPALIRYISDKSSTFRFKAAYALITTIQNNAAIEALIEYIQDKSDPDRGMAVWDFDKIPAEKAVPALIKYIKDKNNPDRDGAAHALGKIGGKEATDVLVQYIEDKSNPDRSLAAEALAKKGNQRAIDIIIECIGDESEETYVFGVLDEIKNERAVDALIRYIQEKESYGHHSHHRAISSLAVIGGKKVISALNNYIRDKSNPDRHGAAHALGEIGGKEEIRLLNGLLPDDHMFITTSIYDAIKSIHQRLKPQGYNPQIKRLSA